MARVGVAVEPGQDIARGRAAQPHERRKGDPRCKREQDDAARCGMRRGANCHAPAHEAARNRIKTASANTSGGHTRSSKSTR